MMDASSQVKIYVDLMCPWAYQTSLWLREIRDVGAIDLSWGLFSLEEVNREKGKKHPWERPWSYGWSMLRVGAYLRRRGEGSFEDYYVAVAGALHRDGRSVQYREVLEEVMDEAGIPVYAVQAAMDDESTNQEIWEDHERVLLAGGYGVPTLTVDDTRWLFGPVIRRAPEGAAALALWSVVKDWSSFSDLYELRRLKSAEDERAIAESFAPYLNARSWRTSQNPHP
ncbi:MAG: DsbA family protein [Acidimicrobiales bacterium]